MALVACREQLAYALGNISLKSSSCPLCEYQILTGNEVPTILIEGAMYYKPVKNSVPKIQERFAKPIKAMIEENPSFGYRTVAWLLGFNKNTVQRIFQLKGWQVRKRSIGFRPRVEALPSVAAAPNERWSTDLCRVWTGRED